MWSEEPRNKPLVQLDISVRYLKHTMREVIYDHAEEISRQIDEVVKSSITRDALKDEVLKAVQDELDKTIRQAIKNSVDTVLYSDEIQFLLKEAIRASLKDILMT